MMMDLMIVKFAFLLAKHALMALVVKLVKDL